MPVPSQQYESLPSLSPRNSYVHINTVRQLIDMMGSTRDIQEWTLADAGRAAAKGFPRRLPAPGIDGYGLVGIDITIDAVNGDLVCHEVNGPNMAGTDSLTGDSWPRTLNETNQILDVARKLGVLTAAGQLTEPVVVLMACQHFSHCRTLSEFIPRVDNIKACLEQRLPTYTVATLPALALHGGADISVVFGDVPRVCKDLQVVENGRLRWRGKTVAYVSNPNILSELCRQGASTNVDTRVFHAGRIVPAFHDRSLQQQLFEGTAVRPLGSFCAFSVDDAVRSAIDLAGRHDACVIKPNGASGGAGVTVITRRMSAAKVRDAVASVIQACVDKYGDHAERFALPIRGFEFVRSRPLELADGGHAWDLRIAAMIWPNAVDVFPVSFRVCPEPFDPMSFQDDRDQWISNVSGRDTTFLRSGLDDEAMKATGMDIKLDDAFDAAVCWIRKAWDVFSKGAGASGIAFEDHCESSSNAWHYGYKSAGGAPNVG